MSDAFKWLMEHGGIMSRKDYPYKGREETCKFVEDKAVVKVESYTDIEHGNET